MNKIEFLYYLLDQYIILKLPESLRETLEDNYLEQCIDSVLSDHPERTLYEIYKYGGIVGSNEFKDIELVETFINWDYEPDINLQDYFSNIELTKYMTLYERQLQSSEGE